MPGRGDDEKYEPSKLEYMDERPADAITAPAPAPNVGNDIASVARQGIDFFGDDDFDQTALELVDAIERDALAKANANKG